MNVLIVEDDKVLSLLLSKMVDKIGANVIGTCVKGQDAISKAKTLSPDLILMDIMLEDDIDGIDAMLALRRESIDVPVIFITGNSDTYNRERAKQTNYIDYLVKPISFDLLKETIEKVE
ncbi:MAG: response regulator [Balneolaceae bacterium]|nr:response regulator [Balneolaceae bacterium]MBO6546203.1 response regulator [Balneolaceae bacterium]MBO6648562.1 response regulator [Balneolaceae bacterium]